MTMNPQRGSLHLIPVPIDEDADHESARAYLAPETLTALYAIDHFIVETPKKARQLLKLLGHPRPIQDLIIHPFPAQKEDLAPLLQPLEVGVSIGVLSDAGCPGVADPGAHAARIAHGMKAPVVPHVGPSSILLALMASGLEGQRFSFSGYLPVQDPDRSQALKALESDSRRRQSTELFIETPYRNEAMLQALLKTLAPATWLTIAIHLTGKDAEIRTQTIADWRKTPPPSLPKRPTLFALLA